MNAKPPTGRLAAFEARLAALREQMEAGLPARAHALRAAADRLAAGDAGAREALAAEGHKLRGMAGSLGHPELTRMGAELETAAPRAEVGALMSMTRRLADAAEGSASGEKRVPDAEPARAREPMDAVPPLGRLAPDGGPALRVLAVDDDETTRKLLELALRAAGGYDATIVGTPAEALVLLRAHAFDVVVADWMMPGTDGLRFTRGIRALGGRMRNLPVVILSAASERELPAVHVPDGPTAWLRKPFRPRELARELAEIVARHRDADP